MNNVPVPITTWNGMELTIHIILEPVNVPPPLSLSLSPTVIMVTIRQMEKNVEK